MKSALPSPKRQKKNARKSAELEQDRLITRIWNLFELEGWSAERIAVAVELPRSEVIQIIQTSTSPPQSKGTNMTQKNFPIHPAAELFPPMTEAEFAGLKEDIRQNGQSDKIVILNGSLIDGRHRLRACHELSIEPEIVELIEETDPWQYVVSHNLHRRHLDTAQRAMVAAKLATLQLGEKKADSGIPLSPMSQSDAAEKLNVSTDSVKQACKIRKYATPEVIAEVESGTMSLNAAVETTKAASTTASIVLDAAGVPVPPKFREANEKRIQLMSIGRGLDKYRKIANELKELPGGEFIHLQNVDEYVRSLKGQFQTAAYHTLCPDCKGEGTLDGGKCKKCHGNGWIPDYLKGTTL